jgi:hypothetical protein
MPLNAITSFSEVISKRMFGEYTRWRPSTSGTSWPRFHLPTAIDSALPLVRERELPWDCPGPRRGCGLPTYMSRRGDDVKNTLMPSPRH